ncbi:MAG: DUF1559 domain-containing protein [Thermoguttaceae bacterium]|jgi:hypothetical protein
MAMATPGFSVFTLLLAIFGGTTLPVGIPPLPEDPVLSRVAPEECLAYMSWSGTAKPSSDSTNQTEQLLAEPEVAQMFARIEGVLLEKLAEGNKGHDTHAKLISDIYPAAKAVLTRPAALFIAKMGVTPQGPDVQGGAVFKLDIDVATVVATLETYQKLLPPDAVEKTAIGKVSGYKIKTPGPPVTWGVAGKYLVVGVGDGTFEAILKRARGSVPPWLAEIRKQSPVKRISTVLYLNVKQVFDQFAPMGGPQVKTVLDATGLAGVTSLATVTGFSSSDFVSRTLVGIDGEPSGALHIMTGKPLVAADLAPIPRDATIAIAARYDLNDVLATVLKVAGQINPGSQVQASEAIKNLDQSIGINLEDDLLKPLGDVWCFYNSPSEGGFLLTGITGVAQVKDHDRLAATLEKLVTLAKSQLDTSAKNGDGNLPGPKIEKFQFAGQDVHFFNARTMNFLIAPAWCLTDKEFIVSTFPQNIKAYLSRRKDFRSLATVPEVASVFESGSGPTSITYADPKQFVQVFYPLFCIGAQGLASEAARNGIPLDVSILPSASSLLPHLRPSLSTVRRTTGGIEMTSRGTFPGLNVASLSGFGIGLALPAVEAARAAGRRAASMNNLKQIALAVLNYESTNNTFPPAYSSAKATGKALLSWRVAILPYVEEQALYQQFHLDEPWDSPNNKKLIEKMPKLYRSPASHARPGMTNYVTFRDKDSVFPGKEPVRMTDIPDGTSNTLMAVEVDDSKAVIWTKPDDLDFNPTNPLVGLGNVWHNGFIVLFCDGSVRFISTGIDPAMMKNLVNRHDGNPIDLNTLDAPPRPAMSPMRKPAPIAPSEGAQVEPESR